MKNKDILKKVLKYIGTYKYLVIISIIAAIVSVVLSLYIPILTGDAIDIFVGVGLVDFQLLLKVILKILIVVLLSALAQWIMNICNNKITYNVVKNIRTEAFNHISKLPLSYIDGTSKGDMVSRIVNDIDQFSDGLLMGFTQLFTGVITIVGTLSFMLMVNYKITLVVFIITPLSLFVAAFIANRTYRMFKEQSETRGEITALIDEMVGNQKIVKAFNHEDENEEKFDEINDRLSVCSLKATFFSSLTNPSTRFINGLVYAGVGIFGALSVINRGMSIGQLSCFLSYANQYTKPFNEISGVITELQNAFACAGRVFELIEETPEIDSDKTMPIGNVVGEIRVENVSFSYVPDVKLIENLNIDVKQGMRVAIVGPTGCGKSTVINLLMRFYDVDKGSIMLDGYNYKDISRKEIRKNYGMVLQETWLKTGTVAENIAYGHKDATKEEIIAAAKMSHAHSFIKRLPKGYDTVISEDGGNLSQGQKQLLSIARVMLKLPPMLILDEATSSIDTRTELKIQDGFKKMMEGRTSFIVAHRLSTIKEVDLILVMKDGNIIEQGNHEELLAKNGFYANLYNSQFAV